MKHFAIGSCKEWANKICKNDTNAAQFLLKQQKMPVPTRPATEKSACPEIPKESIETGVRVLLRLKPCLPGEGVWNIDKNEQSIEVNSHFAKLNRKSVISYTFDGIYEEAQTSDIYQKSVVDFVESAFNGINTLIFAYGQTCSGKTYSMVGSEQNPGIIFLAMKTIFDRIERETGSKFVISYSYFEIYNDRIIDLLNAEEEKEIKLIESKDGTQLWNLTRDTAHNIRDIYRIIRQCENIRHTRETDYNERSSRSHSIFQLILEQSTSENTDSIYTSTITMIDLAGSERASINYACPEKKRETTFINKSLLSLATVIGKLADSKQKHAHIPYRDSKLTRILQPILSGLSAKICIICNIRQERESFEESHRTLIFGQRVNNLDLKPTVNVIRADRAYQDKQEIFVLKQKVEFLSKQLAELNSDPKRHQSIEGPTEKSERIDLIKKETEVGNDGNFNDMKQKLEVKSRKIEYLEKQISELKNVQSASEKSTVGQLPPNITSTNTAQVNEKKGKVKIKALRFELDQTIAEFFK